MTAKNSLKKYEIESTFTTFDGSELFYRAWHPAGKLKDKALVLFHGGHEHSGRFQDLVDRLALRNVSVFAWDARGHGQSLGRRGYSEHYMDVVRDADAFIHHITDTYKIPRAEMVVMGHSVGSVTVATWLHDYAPNIRGVVLGSPAFNVKLYVPFAYPALRLWQLIKADAFVSSYVKPHMLTHDKEEAEQRLNDPLISPDIAVRVLTSLYDTANRVVADAHTITAPVLVLSAGKDWVVKRGVQEKFIENLASSNKELSVYPGFFHEIYHEAERERPIARAQAFIKACFATERDKIDLLEQGENRAEYESLLQELPATSWKKYYFAATAFALKHIGGRLSKGMQVGWKYGFDSGSMLNYVYKNKAHGLTPIGKFIDRLYLDSAGWAGIRQRGDNLQQALTESIAVLKKAHKQVHIMDVAAGPGRYVLNVLEALNDDSLSATCRDRDEAGLAEGRELAASKGLDQHVTYLTGDAFDPESIKDTPQQPQIIIVSGLYELFTDNSMILKSLQGIYDRLPEDGILIYTNQPWHPQLELIARTMVNRDQEPWIMRPRSQNEMNQLVEHVGFKPQKMWIDDAGIFTVSIAHK